MRTEACRIPDFSMPLTHEGSAPRCRSGGFAARIPNNKHVRPGRSSPLARHSQNRFKGEHRSTTIVAREVKKSFSIGRGSKRRVADVLRGVSLRVESGEMVGIVGPSGSWKSTLLYCLSGLEAADSGSIQMMGTQMVHAGRNALSRTRRDHVGFIFQSYNLIPSLSAGENVSLPARLAGRPITKAQTSAVLKSVGLDGRGKSRPGDLSGGEQQRVAIARALAGGADVIFADEPTGALDSRNGRAVLSMLRRIADDPKRSVVMVTHDLEAASMADRILVLRDGRVAREMGRSTPAQILAALEDAEVPA